MSTTDTNISNLIINKLTKAQYEELLANDQLSETELYMITDDYNDFAKKEYVDESIENYAPLKPFPASVNTTGTTAQFITSINSLDYAVGTLLMGMVELSDMPTGISGTVEVKVEVHDNDELKLIMTSPSVFPYVWTYNTTTSSWVAYYQASRITFDNTNTGLQATNVQDAIVEVLNKVGNVGTALDGINGEVV